MSADPLVRIGRWTLPASEARELVARRPALATATTKRAELARLRMERDDYGATWTAWQSITGSPRSGFPRSRRGHRDHDRGRRGRSSCAWRSATCSASASARQGGSLV